MTKTTAKNNSNVACSPNALSLVKVPPNMTFGMCIILWSFFEEM
jgi:hypothetical protein